ncbi:S4 domain-containing protein YaaA [Streptococcus pluranimalium]|uniref:S4 domain-containing protein YaaA n=1 Tax=Streptococcus pluranimalium TaxID=82348 RepID=A0A2L0D6J3_9STRE|nr:S4 domain-containing protein YaaA [Streptococcus pluranimalium]AUW97466.1 S4 domain-containing protein YaaA [Streptococcus pluranimalium]
MDYKLFDDYITLQALLKETGIIQSGGAIKGYLADNTVLFNGQDEKRRGKKLRRGDKVELLSQGITITLIQPNEEEFKQHQLDLEEKNRVAELVKKMNKNNKKQVKKANTTSKTARQTKKPVRFPGM